MNGVMASDDPRTKSQTDPVNPSFAEALRVWLRIGLLSFGGPAGQIALMHRELVEQRRWISEARFLHALNYCMLLPGPEAQQLATYIGWLLHGWRGGIVAGVLFVVPGFLVILALAALYALYQETHWAEAIFFGLKAAVLAIVVEAVWRLGRRALKTRFSLAMAASAFGALFVFDAPFPLVVLLAGATGFAYARFAPAALTLQDAEPVQDAGGAYGASYVLRVIGLWGALWLAPFVLIVALAGYDNVFLSIAAFFSKMAVVTFGGAYAALAYVAQQAVETHQWLAPGEMLDGLALAETTPGPLLLVLTFVGFLAAFRNPLGLDPMLAGVLGAILTTWVTFAPCFLWIFLGAPFIERLRANKALANALGAVTAAVVGVILNLALWFAIHFLFGEIGSLKLGWAALPAPRWASLDVAALGLAAFALVALLRFKIGVPLTLCLCAIMGIALRWAVPASALGTSVVGN
jgi:chromate transporter